MQNILITETAKDYELLDSGGGEKLERYGAVILSRPDPQALWPKSLSSLYWQNAHAAFVRSGTLAKWNIKKEIPKKWSVTLEGVTFSLELLPSKHVGVFPEQSAHWKWLTEKISSAGREVSVLNLFGYSGGSSLAALKAGAKVTHVDASEFAVDLTATNRDLSGLKDKPIRLIVDDVRKFVEREIKRGNKYDIILLDPPVYGKGSKGETWNIDEDLMPLLSRIISILSESPLAIILNGYASGYSHIAYKQMLETATKDLDGAVSSGELAIQESGSTRLLPAGIFARWVK